MLRIRLRQMGKKRQHYYRVVVADQRAPRDGGFLEILGSYDPHANPPSVSLNEERAREWLVKGAQPSEAVDKIFRRAGVIEGGPRRVKEAPPKEAAPAAEAAAPEAEAPVAEAEEPAATATEEPAAAEAEAEAPAAEAETGAEAEAEAKE